MNGRRQPARLEPELARRRPDDQCLRQDRRSIHRTELVRRVPPCTNGAAEPPERGFSHALKSPSPLPMTLNSLPYSSIEQRGLHVQRLACPNESVWPSLRAASALNSRPFSSTSVGFACRKRTPVDERRHEGDPLVRGEHGGRHRDPKRRRVTVREDSPAAAAPDRPPRAAWRIAHRRRRGRRRRSRCRHAAGRHSRTARGPPRGEHVEGVRISPVTAAAEGVMSPVEQQREGERQSQGHEVSVRRAVLTVA